MLKQKSIPIVEVFDSIQGEGPRLRPAIFVRSGLCSLKCPGFSCKATAPDGSEIVGCDTIRAVSSKFRDQWQYYEDYNELVKRIQSHVHIGRHGRSIQDIIWTGGEPLLWWNTEVMQNTLAWYISRGHQVTIETNASLDIDFTRKYQKEIMFSMSPKLANSGEPKERRLNLDTITKVVEEAPKSYLKFVVNPETWDIDKEEIFEILDAIPYYMQVYLMPLGHDRETLSKNTTFVIERCKELGFNYTDRIHIRAWGTKEGV